MKQRSSLFLLAQYTLALSLALLLAACSKSSSPTGPGSGGVITVTGKVIGVNGQPVASVPVLVTGLPSVNTDANGNFTIGNVTTPYTVSVVDGANRRALVYRGLTRTDPTLFWFGATPGTQRHATVSGTLTPWTAPGSGTQARIGFASPDAFGEATVTLATGNFSIVNNWYGPTATTGTLYALVWSYDANGLPVTYSRFGKRSGVSLLDGTTNANQNDTIGVAQTAQLTGTISVPAGYTLSEKALYAVFESKVGLPLLVDGTSTPNFTYNTPNVPGAALSLVTVASNGTGDFVETFMSGIAVAQTGVATTIPTAPELSLPVNNATGVTTSTPFSWTPLSGGIQIISFSPSVAGQPSFTVFTAASSDSIPNLASAGLPLPSSAAYNWRVQGVAPFASMDAAAGSGGPLGFVTSPYSFTGSYGSSAARNFTTAP